jgi:hypothetical protein
MPIEPGGVVADYAPFYYAPRSPMLYAIHMGRVPEYTDGLDPLVYLVTTVDRLAETCGPLVFTDRNAALASSLVQFSASIADLDAMIDWNLMQATMWRDTLEEPDRRERRMAECLVHGRVPWEAFFGIVARTEARKAEVEEILREAAVEAQVQVRSNWYF